MNQRVIESIRKLNVPDRILVAAATLVVFAILVLGFADLDYGQRADFKVVVGIVGLMLWFCALVYPRNK